jgi:hypothetical protein
MTWHLPYRKAIIGVTGALGQLVALGALHGTAQTVAQVTLAFLTALGVYQVPNVTAAPVPPDDGHSEVDTVLLVLAVTGVLLLLVGVHFR